MNEYFLILAILLTILAGISFGIFFPIWYVCRESRTKMGKDEYKFVFWGVGLLLLSVILFIASTRV